MTNKSNNFDVLIIGAGVMGSAIAFKFIESGQKVGLIEKRILGQNASGKNAGNLNPILNTSPGIINSAIKSMSLHKELHAKLVSLGCSNYLLEKANRLLLAFDKQDEVYNKQIVDLYNQYSPAFSAKTILPKEIKSIDPRIAETAISAAYLIGNMAIDSYAFNLALVDGFRKLGGVLISTEAKAIRQSDNALDVTTDFGNVFCKKLIIATGPWTQLIDDEFKFKIPVKPLKGELLRLHLPGNKFTHDLTYKETSIYQRSQSNEVWVGGTNDDIGFDETINQKNRIDLIDRAIKIFPDIKNAMILEHTAALRAIHRDGVPFFESIEANKNIFVANGGSWKGVLFSTLISDIAFEQIMFNKNYQLN